MKLSLGGEIKNMTQSLKDKAIKKFNNRFPMSVEISDRPGSFAILRSSREQKEMNEFISQLVDDTYKAGIKDERKRSEKEFLNPLKRKIRNSL